MPCCSRSVKYSVVLTVHYCLLAALYCCSETVVCTVFILLSSTVFAIVSHSSSTLCLYCMYVSVYILSRGLSMLSVCTAVHVSVRSTVVLLTGIDERA